jgi:hypothetical protein
MNTRQKSILSILSISLIGILAVFSLYIWLNSKQDLSKMIPSPVCGTTGENGISCDLEVSNDLTEPSLIPETRIPIAPSVEIEPSIIPSLSTGVGITTPAIPSLIPLPCPIEESGGLVTEMRTIIAAMPQAGSNGFIPPTDVQIAGWESLIQAIMDDDIPAACALIQSNGFPYELVLFTDTGNENQPYVMLREVEPVQVGWGTYVFSTGKSATPLVIEIPHPQADWNTEIEGVEIFRKTNARALLVSGTHRCSNDAFSSCTGITIACGQVEPYRLSDVGHGVQNMFHAAHKVLVECRSKTVAIQLHGNSVSNCPDIFVSNGTTKPGTIAGNISDAITASCREYNVDLANGEPGECAFTGGGSPQAVLTNSCRWSNPPDACTSQVLRPSGPDQFISIEQSLSVRKNFGCVVKALVGIFNP